ncbi:hypothetical protein [Streptomyces sp. NPDC059761]|uniref:hypothetical protein n=1 Tax=Streptomyces sp. NPDC059761 TaxID=3346937 RepID=UPI0036609229
MKIRRSTATRVGTVLTAVAAAGLLAAGPASAQARTWTSCSGSMCDGGSVDNQPLGNVQSIVSVYDGSRDGIGAVVQAQLFPPYADAWVGTTNGAGSSNSANLMGDVRRARICDWDGRTASNCGGWEYF